MTNDRDAGEALDAWIKDNQARITDAVLRGLSEVEQVAEVMVDPSVQTAEQWQQRIEALDLASSAVLPEHIGDSFEREFNDVTPSLRQNLKVQACSIVRESLPEYIDELYAWVIKRRGGHAGSA